MNKNQLEEIKEKYNFESLGEFVDAKLVSPYDLKFLIEQAEKQITIEVTKASMGGGLCPSCDVRLIGKANYCGKCGQRIGWKIHGGNIYDREESRN